MHSPLLTALHATGPAPDRADKMMLYGQFVGSWEGRLTFLDASGVRREAPAEVHFGWVLEGRAIQDVWIATARHVRDDPEAMKLGSMYGTTLRVYDPRRDLWHITFIDPVDQEFTRLIGRKVGNDIVNEFRAEDGALCQWCFTEITADSFHWIGRRSKDDGKTWLVRNEYFMQRRATVQVR